MCSSLVECWLTIMWQFPSGGDVLRELLMDNFWEILFEFAFYVIVMVIIFNILFGIIMSASVRRQPGGGEGE